MSKPDDMAGVYAAIGKIQTDKANERELTRARIAAWSPEFLTLLDGMRDADMAPRLVRLEIPA